MVSFEAAARRTAAGSKAPATAVRWCGWVRPSFSGKHRFHSRSRVTRIEIGRQLVAGPGSAGDFEVDLVAGQLYSILVEVSDLSKLEPDMLLQWTVPGGVRYPIPQSVLYPPVRTIDPGC